MEKILNLQLIPITLKENKLRHVTSRLFGRFYNAMDQLHTQKHRYCFVEFLFVIYVMVLRHGRRFTQAHSN
jgi:hypothetical protein